MKRVICLSAVLLSLCATLCAVNNPKPVVNQPLVPASAAPGAAGFTLTVNGTGFVTGAVVKWNGNARTTTFISSSSLQATILSTDVAHAGTASVTVSNPTPHGGASNVVYFPVHGSTPSVAFAPEPNVAPLAGPIAVGDFTGDNKLDLVVGQTSPDGTTGSILYYKGQGNGGFATPITTTSSLPVQQLLVGDFNGDGKLDVMIGTKNGAFGPAEGIAFINVGSGNFTEKTAFGTGDFGGPLAIADLNGDGILDVVFGSEVQGAGTVYFYLGNGDGTFTLKSSQSMNNSVGFAAIGDFNGDGKLDVAVPEGPQMDVFLGNGDGTFQPFVPYTTTCGGTAAAADLNGDGKLDLVLGNLCVLLGKGDGTFTVGTGNGSGAAPIAIGDFNGDGKLDVVGPGGQVYLGNGDGTFQNPTTTTFATNASATIPFGDFNRDGQLDLAIIGSSSVQIGLQTSLRVTPGSLSFGSHKVGTTSAKQAVTLTDVGSKSVPITSIAISGTNAGDFSQQNNCGVGLQSGKSCTANVVFKPTATGARSATLTITYSGVDTPQTVALSGTGT